ncbi:hypothetical protein AN911_00450 [Mycobacteroides immunogenum]|uniref:4Fe-4S Wbl-type domain-containing protein n=1 Tax=Mycobacteroides immunogenum TaxID=83262 RepID=A0A7V8LSB0_9MYCO|nr:hypothetical protein AN909_05485 [Mycobacteroides immunogenum]KPG14751.1 hypothetical protein AN908_06920 [Mycobacteroides immunogenum]KPG17617.1 hypothetical protein AN910_04710 [Mycobacteroides immunogenum]KPG24858.1 hypothetical protein AN911_00450 [Mycobacteroides immunogenum]KPG39150.1 hypothetical protein AN914_10005 [Mycobacteroides immunogenum]
MQNAPEHWSERASCKGDARFIQPLRLLVVSDLKDMQRTCLGCEEFEACFDWAKYYGDEVFAAGEFWERSWPESGLRR